MCERLCLELSHEELERMNRLMFMTGSKTRAELFNNALSLLQWALAQTASGKVVAVVDQTSQSYRELIAVLDMGA